MKRLENMRNTRGDLEGHADLVGGGSLRETNCIVKEHLVGSGLDDERWEAGQVGEDRADAAC